MIEVHLSSLEVITDQRSDSDKPIPSDLREAIMQSFPDALVAQSGNSPTMPAGAIGARLPKSTIILRVNAIAWNLTRALLNLWLVSERYLAGDNPAAVAVASANLLDSIRCIPQLLDRLHADKGELCTYQAVVQALPRLSTDLGVYPTKTDLWESHQVVRTCCPQVSCQYHLGECSAQRSDIEIVVEELVDRDILRRKKDDRLWVVF